MGLAAAGLAWLAAPAATRPAPVGTLLMVVAGVAWGIYSPAGKRASDLLAANARSFLWARPLTLLVAVATRGRSPHVGARGATLGAISGAVISALGYAVWYRALRGLTATPAAVVQPSVPVIAALGAVLLLQERVSPRLVTSGVAVIGGLALVLWRRSPRSR